MENRDLRIYLTKTGPSKPLQLLWFREMVCALACIHDHGIIVADIASRNFLVTSKSLYQILTL
jgi:DNA-binding helix-hairpin-helix protein with protein kinase domain